MHFEEEIRGSRENVPLPPKGELSHISFSQIPRIRLPQKFFARENFKAAVLCLLNLIFVITVGNVAWNMSRIDVMLLAFILIGARAQSLYILQHECMHRLLFSSRRVNDVVGSIISGSIGSVLFVGRTYHFKHHRDPGGVHDPNEVWHTTRDRMPGQQVALYFLGQLFGGRIFKSAILGFFKKRIADRRSIQTDARDLQMDLFALAVCQLIIFGIFVFASSVWAYFILYIAPLLTVTAFLEAVRSFSEHVLPGSQARTLPEKFRLFYMCSNPIECFFVSQFQFHYHHLHHLYPNVVTFKMAELHAFLLKNDPNYPSTFIERPGYFGTLYRYFKNQPLPGAGEGYPLRYMSGGTE